MIKKFSGMFFCVLLLTALLGCGNSDNRSTYVSVSPTESAEEPVVLRFAWWGDEYRAEVTQKVVDLFMEKNPDIRIQTAFYPYDKYYENLQISAETGYMPDVWQGYVGANNYYMNASLVEALDVYIDRGLIHVSDISDNLMDSGKIDGKTYGIPMSCNVKCMAVNLEDYKRAGLQVPEVGYASWEELEADLLKLAEYTDLPVCNDFFAREFLFAYFCKQRGESVFAYPDKLNIGFSRSTYVDYYEMKIRWEEAGLTPTYQETLAGKKAGTQNKEEEYSVFHLYSSDYTGLMEKKREAVKLILLPGPGTEKGTDIRPGMHMCMSSTSKYKDAAAKFIDFFINDLEANRILDAERGMPVSSRVRDIMISDFSEDQKKMAEIVSLAEEHSSSLGFTLKIDTSEVDGDINEHSIMEDLEQKIMFGQLTPDEAYTVLFEKYGVSN